MWCSTSSWRFHGRRPWRECYFRSCTRYPACEAGRSLQAVANFLQASFRTIVIEIAAGRASGADAADDLVVQLDHHAAGKDQDMRQLGECRDRTVAFGAVGQNHRVVLERDA